MKVTILNTSILTAEGQFDFRKIDLSTAQYLITENEFQSAIGHQSTADILTSLLNIEVKLNRINYKQEQGEIALVFKLRGRPEEGKILTKEEIELIGYEFYILTKMV